MIIGYASLNGMEEFDYYGCLYPKGFSGVESVVCFNHEDINEVYDIEFDEEDSGTEYEFDEDGNVVLEDGLAVEGLGLPTEDDEEEEESSDFEFDEEGNVILEDGLAVEGLGFATEDDEDEIEEEPIPEIDEVSIFTMDYDYEDIPPIGPGLPGYEKPVEEVENTSEEVTEE